MFLVTFVTDDNIYEVKTIACEVVFQFKSNLNVFKGVVIIYQEIVAAFTPLSLQLNMPGKTSPYSALGKSFLRLGC